jgi:hypothetical protein
MYKGNPVKINSRFLQQKHYRPEERRIKYPKYQKRERQKQNKKEVLPNNSILRKISFKDLLR